MVKSVIFNSLWNDSIEFFKKNFMMLFLIGVLFYFLPRVYVGYNNLIPEFEFIGELSIPQIRNMLLAVASTSLFASLLFVSVAYSMKSKKKNASAKDVINGASKYYLKAIGLSIVLAIALFLIFLVVAVPLLLLLGILIVENQQLISFFVVLAAIPALYFLIRWIFSTCILVFEDSFIIGSVKKSTKIVKGRWWDVFFKIVLIGLVMGLVNYILLLGIILFEGAGYTNNLFNLISTNLLSTFTTLFVSIFLINYYLTLKK
ncbi:MAG: hypothetical protein IH845_01595 [Nanoarchaeota archaeon]|nr:hypothetical protein [Nanoarchaeota archaeon]